MNSIDRMIFVTMAVAATCASASCQREAVVYEAPAAEIVEVPFTNVSIHDDFWTPRIEANRMVSIPSAFHECEANGRFDNFAIAGGLKKVSIAATSRLTTLTLTRSSRAPVIRWP